MGKGFPTHGPNFSPISWVDRRRVGKGFPTHGPNFSPISWVDRRRVGKGFPTHGPNFSPISWVDRRRVGKGFPTHGPNFSPIGWVDRRRVGKGFPTHGPGCFVFKTGSKSGRIIRHIPCSVTASISRIPFRFSLPTQPISKLKQTLFCILASCRLQRRRRDNYALVAFDPPFNLALDSDPQPLAL